ncbi:MAG: TRAP transporter small permease [Rhodobacteraceae bacterium]|nr:TRAP transporter small permease [Paracoccaceae bacterium]
MSAHSPVLEDDSLLSKLDRTLYKLETHLALIGGLAAFSLVMLAVVSVTGRNLFNRPLPGYVDWIEQAMPLLAFVGVSYTQRLGGHIRMDILVGRLRGRWLWGAELASTITMLILMLLLVWGTWAHFQRSFDFGSPNWSRDSSLDISLPLWPAKLLVTFSFAVLSLRLMLQVWGYTVALLTGAKSPIAVPLPINAATAAANEAATVSGFDEETNV